MGAWGLLNFDNDTALDFVAEVEEEGGVEQIRSAIEIINSIEEAAYLDSDLCCEALAAIEYIAAAKGKASNDFPEDSEAWLKAHTASILTIRGVIAKSQQAIDRIQHNSELKELWEETEEFDAWVKVLQDLNTRIS